MLKALLTRENTDKRILYIAYYTRQPSARNTEPFHSALLVVPKDTITITDLQNCTRYEVHNPLLLDPTGTGNIVEFWAYRQLDCRPRTLRLAALQKLGKLPNKYDGDALQALFLHILPEPVPLASMPSGWRCHNWVIAAIEALIGAGVVSVAERTATGILQAGIDTLNQRNASVQLMDYTEPVFTIDMDGKVIPSQIGPIRV